MFEGFAGREAPLKDRRMWRLLLARLHPDAGGDNELFLFACALMDAVREERRSASGSPGRPAAAGHDGPGSHHTFSRWRGNMSSWASLNREGLRKPVTPRRSRPPGC